MIKSGIGHPRFQPNQWKQRLKGGSGAVGILRRRALLTGEPPVREHPGK
jgi:hypothetical protein